MKNPSTLATAVLACGFLHLATVAGNASVFSDNFDNTVPADSDSTAGFWTVNSSIGPGGANAVVESGGNLQLSVGDSDGTNLNNFSGVSLLSSVSSDFNFFTQSLTFQARGISFGGTTSAGQQQLRLALNGTKATSFNSPDSVVLLLKGNGSVQLGSKLDTPGGSSDGTVSHTSFDLGDNNSITGFDLTLGPGTGNLVNYHLTVYNSSGGGATRSGSFALDVAQWGDPGSNGGSSCLMLWAQELNATDGTHNYMVALDSLAVVPATGEFSENFDNDIPADADEKPGFWTVSTANPGGSANAIVESAGFVSMTVGDNDGVEDNTQNSSGVSMISGVSSDFNFFTKPITIQVRGISFGGDRASEFFRERFRLALTATSLNTFSSPDAVVVRVSRDGTINLGSKVDTPGASSDGTATHQNFDLGDDNSVTGFDLTIGPGIAAGTLDYTLIGFGGSGQTASGSFALDVADWDGAGGNAALVLWAQENSVTGGNENYTVSIDSIKVAPVLSGGDAPTLVISRNGGNLDFQWNSTSGNQYDLLSSTDLTASPETWPVYNDGVTTYENIAASGSGTNTLTGVVPSGSRRFFVLREEPQP